MKGKTKRPEVPAATVVEIPSIPIAAVFSFLKQTRALDNWTVGDIAKALKVSATAAKQVLAVLALQGYVKPQDSNWTTTSSGYEVSGSVMPRLKRESVESAVKQLSERIRVINEDSTAAYRVIQAVAFGDFINKTGSRVQPADVGVQLEPRKTTDVRQSVGKQQSEQAFLKRLRGRSPMLNVRRYEDWMTQRPNLKIIVALD